MDTILMSFNPIGNQVYVYCPFCAEQFVFHSKEDAKQEFASGGMSNGKCTHAHECNDSGVAFRSNV